MKRINRQIYSLFILFIGLNSFAQNDSSRWHFGVKAYYGLIHFKNINTDVFQSHYRYSSTYALNIFTELDLGAKKKWALGLNIGIGSYDYNQICKDNIIYREQNLPIEEREWINVALKYLKYEANINLAYRLKKTKFFVELNTTFFERAYFNKEAFLNYIPAIKPCVKCVGIWWGYDYLNSQVSFFPKIGIDYNLTKNITFGLEAWYDAFGKRNSAFYFDHLGTNIYRVGPFITQNNQYTLHLKYYLK